MIPNLRIIFNFKAAVDNKRCFSIAVLWLALMILLAKPVQAGSASNLWVTDVTTRSFSLVWTTNGSAAGSAIIYADPEGNNMIEGLTIIDVSKEHPPAGDIGVIKVTIIGLIPDTTYYFEIVTTSSAGEMVEPTGGALPSVQTEISSLIVENISLAHRMVQSDGLTPAAGGLLLAEVEGGNYPITGWVGDGVAPPFVLVDLNNIYSETTHQNLELDGGEAITLTSIGGSRGNMQLIAAVPAETNAILTLKNPEPCPLVSQNPDVYDDGLCTLDIPGPIIDACAADFDGDRDIDGHDIAALVQNPIQLAVSTFTSKLGQTECSVFQ